MVNINKLTCPGCGASIDNVEDSENFFCTYCGSQVKVEDDNVKLTKISEEITHRIEVPRIDCEYCGGTIFLNDERKHKCKTCGKIVCETCYNEESKICKECLLEEKRQKDEKNRISNAIRNIILLVLTILMIVFFYMACNGLIF